MEAKGIKETKEALIGAVALGAFVIERAKDGIDMNDAMALAGKLASDEDFKMILQQAIMGIDQVPAEIKDISFAEAIEIAGVIPELLRILGK